MAVCIHVCEHVHTHTWIFYPWFNIYTKICKALLKCLRATATFPAYCYQLQVPELLSHQAPVKIICPLPETSNPCGWMIGQIPVPYVGPPGQRTLSNTTHDWEYSNSNPLNVGGQLSLLGDNAKIIDNSKITKAVLLLEQKCSASKAQKVFWASLSSRNNRVHSPASGSWSGLEDPRWSSLGRVPCCSVLLYCKIPEPMPTLLT